MLEGVKNGETTSAYVPEHSLLRLHVVSIQCAATPAESCAQLIWSVPGKKLRISNIRGGNCVYDLP